MWEEQSGICMRRLHVEYTKHVPGIPIHHLPGDSRELKYIQGIRSPLPLPPCSPTINFTSRRKLVKLHLASPPSSLSPCTYVLCDPFSITLTHPHPYVIPLKFLFLSILLLDFQSAYCCLYLHLSIPNMCTALARPVER
jgi:hypothetical protein